MERTDVIVVGAGFSGLAAALALRQNHKSVRVLEAQNRVGGRAYTITTERGSTIDLGAQWISPYQTRMQRLVKQFGLTLVTTYAQGQTIYDFLGKQRKRSGKIPAISPTGLVDLMLLQQKVKRILRHLSAEEPWSTELARKLDHQTMEAWLGRNMFSKSGYAFYSLFMEEAFSSELYECSALDALWCIKTTGGFDELLTAEHQWIEEGAQALAERMAHAVEESISLSSPVYGVQYGPEGVTVDSGRGVFQAKRLILALPPALAGRIRFDPPLPAIRDQMMQRAGQSAIIKCVAVYDVPFWRRDGLNGSAYLDDGAIKVTLDSSTPNRGEGVLATFVGGRTARLLTQQPQEQRKEAVFAGLKRLFGSEAAQPVHYFEKDWTADPWARGGYAAHFGTGFIHEFGPELMKAVGPIHWAGTETSTEWRLYMEGAVQAGERAALEALQALNQLDPLH